MSYLRGFIPWIAFAVLSSAGWQWGALAALAIGLWLIIQDRRSGVPGDALILESSTVAYFAAVTALAFADPHTALKPYSGAISFTWLAVTAWTTLAVHHPFTLGIARRTTPSEYWDTPQFLRINVVITTVWAAAFTATAAAVAAFDAAHAGTVATTCCQVVGFTVPAVFTSRYPKIIQARYAAAGLAAS